MINLTLLDAYSVSAIGCPFIRSHELMHTFPQFWLSPQTNGHDLYTEFQIINTSFLPLNRFRIPIKRIFLPVLYTLSLSTRYFLEFLRRSLA